MVVTAALHAPSRRGDERNYHAHILMTTRRMEETGLGKKTRELDGGREEVRHIREYAAQVINEALERAGVDEWVDHRSFQDRGIELEPTQHLGQEATAMERRNEATRIGDNNREAVAYNQNLDQLVGDLAELDAQIAAAMEQEFLAEREPVATPVMTREEWEAYKREMQSAVRSENAQRHSNQLKEQGQMSLPENSPALYDVDTSSRHRAIQDRQQPSTKKDDLEPS